MEMWLTLSIAFHAPQVCFHINPRWFYTLVKWKRILGGKNLYRILAKCCAFLVSTIVTSCVYAPMLFVVLLGQTPPPPLIHIQRSLPFAGLPCLTDSD